MQQSYTLDIVDKITESWLNIVDEVVLDIIGLEFLWNEKKMDKYLFSLLDKLPPSVTDDPSSMIAIGTTLLVLLLTLVYFVFISKRRGGDRIAIVGLSESGKTVLFSQLVGRRNVTTLTSMRENEATVRLAGKSITLVDVPGYERLRVKSWEDIRDKTRAIVFLIDSHQVTTNLRDVADYLFSIMTDKLVRSRRIPFLIACNKQDKPKSKAAKVIKSLLEKELSAVRETRLAALDSTDGERDEGYETLGSMDKEFTFDDIRNRIDFVDCTALTDDTTPAQLESVTDWLSKI